MTLNSADSVDAKTEELMLRIIKDDLQDRTIIAVAHNLNTILDFDRIALLSEGKLVEFDSPTDLLARKSAFKELYDSFNKKNKEQEKETQKVGEEEPERSKAGSTER